MILRRTRPPILLSSGENIGLLWFVCGDITLIVLFVLVLIRVVFQTSRKSFAYCGTTREDAKEICRFPTWQSSLADGLFDRLKLGKMPPHIATLAMAEIDTKAEAKLPSVMGVTCSSVM